MKQNNIELSCSTVTEYEKFIPCILIDPDEKSRFKNQPVTWIDFEYECRDLGMPVIGESSDKEIRGL